MKITLCLTLALLFIALSNQKWAPSTSLRKLLSVGKDVKHLPAHVRKLYHNALDQEILLQKGLKIRILKGDKKESYEPTTEALQNQTPISEKENIWMALRNWLTAENEKLQARTNVQVQIAKIWEASGDWMQKAQTAFNEDGNSDMCARAEAAHKVHEEFDAQKSTMKKKVKELKKLVKPTKKSAKNAWKELVMVTNDELKAAPAKRRSQLKKVTPDIDLVEGDGTGGEVMPDTETCGGENSELCNAFMEMYSAHLMEVEYKKAYNDAKFAKKEYKARCHQEFENSAFPDGKSPSKKATWGGLMGDLKKCEAEYEKTVKEEGEKTKDAYKAAKKNCKKASKSFHKIAKKTCGGKSGKKDKRDKKDKKDKKGKKDKKSKSKDHVLRRLIVQPY